MKSILTTLKNKIYLVVLVVLMVVGFILTGCNKQLIDTTQYYDRAILSLPDGTIVEGKVQSWKDYEGDQIQVKINGTYYLVHSSNIALIAD